MSSPKSYIKLHRKKSPLTQADIAFLMERSDVTAISKCEKGYRYPSIKLLFIYRFLFNTCIESFFPRRSKKVLNNLVKRLELLQDLLKSKEKELDVKARIKFIEKTLKRLRGLPDYEKA